MHAHASFLSAALKQNKLLMTLEIGGNLIGDRSAEHIGTAPWTLVLAHVHALARTVLAAPAVALT